MTHTTKPPPTRIIILDPGEPDMHPAWAQYEYLLSRKGEYTPEELEEARKAAEKEGYGRSF